MSASLEGSRRVLLVGAATAGARRVIARARLGRLALAAVGHVGVDGGSVISGTSSGRDGVAARSRLSCINSLRVLGATGMILTASRGALHVVATILDALVAPFCADEVGKSQGVLGNIGLQAVTTNAAVSQSFLQVSLAQEQAVCIRGMAHTGLQSLTLVVPSATCWQMMGQVCFSDAHHCSARC